MPTTLPVRAAAASPSDGLGEFVDQLLQIYLVIAIVIAAVAVSGASPDRLARPTVAKPGLSAPTAGLGKRDRGGSF